MTSPTETRIFKIFTPADWDDLRASGRTRGSALDRKDGFLHFSTAEQLPDTLSLHFKGAGPLIVARVPLAALMERDVRWEAARGGTLFPHLYGLLDLGEVDRHWRLSPDANGAYELPDLA
ncbi:MAG: DUF952 domain-containing protein [Litorimonas sp.]